MQVTKKPRVGPTKNRRIVVVITTRKGTDNNTRICDAAQLYVCQEQKSIAKRTIFRQNLKTNP